MGGSARRASVTGPPSTSRTGATIDISMWVPMCTLNIAGAYRPMPDEVASRITRQPHEPRDGPADRPGVAALAQPPHAEQVEAA